MPAPFLSSGQSSHVGTGVMNPAHLLTPVSHPLDLDGINKTPSDHKGARKRKREPSLSHMQLGTPESCKLPNAIDSPATARSLSTSHDHYGRTSKSRRNDSISSFDSGYVSDLDTVYWNEFARDRAQVGSLSNVALLRIYWFAHGRVEAWVGSRLPKHLNHKKVEIVSWRGMCFERCGCGCGY